MVTMVRFLIQSIQNVEVDCNKFPRQIQDSVTELIQQLEWNYLCIEFLGIRFLVINFSFLLEITGIQT